MRVLFMFANVLAERRYAEYVADREKELGK